MARESKDLCWAAVVLIVDSAILLRVNERFLIVASFTFTPNQGGTALPKEANPESWMLPGNSHPNLWLRTGKVPAVEASKVLRVNRPRNSVSLALGVFFS